MRKTIPIEWLADSEPLRDLPDVDSYPARWSGNEWRCLLRREIRWIESAAGMTYREALVFEYFALGYDVDTIRRLVGPDTPGLLESAVRKARGVPHVGLLTVIAESFGFGAALDWLDRRE